MNLPTPDALCVPVTGIQPPAPYFCESCGWDVADERGCSQGCGYKYVTANRRAVDRSLTDERVSELARDYIDAMDRRKIGWLPERKRER